jgi:hypothetical protein
MPAPRRCDAVECATARQTVRIGRTLIDQRCGAGQPSGSQIAGTMTCALRRVVADSQQSSVRLLPDGHRVTGIGTRPRSRRDRLAALVFS